jgi:hypothetical protein
MICYSRPTGEVGTNASGVCDRTSIVPATNAGCTPPSSASPASGSQHEPFHSGACKEEASKPEELASGVPSNLPLEWTGVRRPASLKRPPRRPLSGSSLGRFTWGIER